MTTHPTDIAAARAALARLLDTLNLASRQAAEVGELSLKLDGDHSHLTFAPVLPPSAHQHRTAFTEWRARAEEFLLATAS